MVRFASVTIPFIVTDLPTGMIKPVSEPSSVTTFKVVPAAILIKIFPCVVAAINVLIFSVVVLSISIISVPGSTSGKVVTSSSSKSVAPS